MASDVQTPFWSHSDVAIVTSYTVNPTAHENVATVLEPSLVSVMVPFCGDCIWSHNSEILCKFIPNYFNISLGLHYILN